MATLTLANFRSQCPEFTPGAWPDSLVERWIDVARTIYSDNPTGIAYLTAHLLTCGREDGIIGDTVPDPDEGAGEVTSETTGRRTLNFMAMAERGREVFYTRSAYGRLFLIHTRVRPRRAIGMMVCG